MSSCPYKKIYYNAEEKTAQKCIFCFPRVEQSVAPACVRQCPGRLRFTGYRDDRQGPIWQLVDKWQVALPLHEEYGTGPNVFYVPPLAPTAFDDEGRYAPDVSRIPDHYLESLFGTRVHAALATLKAEMARTRAGERSELMDILIARRWTDMFGGLDRDPDTLTWKSA